MKRLLRYFFKSFSGIRTRSRTKIGTLLEAVAVVNVMRDLRGKCGNREEIEAAVLNVI